MPTLSLESRILGIAVARTCLVLSKLVLDATNICLCHPKKGKSSALKFDLRKSPITKVYCT